MSNNLGFDHLNQITINSVGFKQTNCINDIIYFKLIVNIVVPNQRFAIK